MYRQTLRTALVIALTSTLVGGWFPTEGGASFPETVLRRSGVSARDLAAGRKHAGLTARPGGALHSSAPARTAPVRLCSQIWFTAVGVTWTQAAGDPPEVRIAAGPARGSLRNPRHLAAEGGEEPGSPGYETGAAASSLLWTGGARCVRLSVEFPARAAISDLEVVFVNSSGTAAGPGTAPPQPQAAAAETPGSLFAPTAASAMTTRPRIITRSEWGANPKLLNCGPRYAPEVKMAFVHHTAGANGYSRSEADDVVRGIYAFHTNGRGWCDIAYNFLVDRFGRVYEGRAGGITRPVISAATQGFNIGSASVSTMGNFSTRTPSPAMMRGLNRTLAWRLDLAHVPPRGYAQMVSTGGPNTRYSAGTKVRLNVISGHRRTGYTSCPGNRLANRLRRIRRTVSRIGTPKIYRPSLSASSVEEMTGNRLKIRATGSGSLQWTVELLADDDVVGSDTAEGSKLDMSWGTSDSAPIPRAPGRYTFVISAIAGSRSALPASFPFSVKAG